MYNFAQDTALFGAMEIMKMNKNPNVSIAKHKKKIQNKNTKCKTNE